MSLLLAQLPLLLLLLPLLLPLLLHVLLLLQAPLLAQLPLPLLPLLLLLYAVQKAIKHGMHGGNQLLTLSSAVPRREGAREGCC